MLASTLLPNRCVHCPPILTRLVLSVPPGDRGVERIERDGRIGVALDPLPQLPDFDGGCDLVARRQPADPPCAPIDAVTAGRGGAVQRHRAEAGHVAAAIAHLLERRQDGADVEERTVAAVSSVSTVWRAISSAASPASAATRIGSPNTMAPRPNGRLATGTVPIVGLDAAAGGDRNRDDRAPGELRELDDAWTGLTRHFGNVGGERHRPAVLQRGQHGLEGADPALAVEPAVVIARAADGSDAEPLRHGGIDLAIAVARDQDLDAVMSPHERHHEMLAVPHGDDHRKLRLDALVEIFGLDDEAAGLPHQPKIVRGEDAGRCANPAGVADALKHSHADVPFNAPNVRRRCPDRGAGACER